jgi:DNA-binding MarR family transcriptional regulator
MQSQRTLGTALRHLLSLLDDELAEIYRADGLNYRPRYTPIVRTLQEIGPASIKQIARHAGMTHSAVSQTITQMSAAGWVSADRGLDGRERIVALTPSLISILPQLETRWRATNAAASSLDEDLSYPLTRLVAETIEALERRSFSERIRAEEKM